MTSVLAAGIALATAGASATPLVPPPTPSPTQAVGAAPWSRDYAIRSLGELELSNLRGAIEVRGWALDKIRVQATERRLRAPDGDSPARSVADVRFSTLGDRIEVSAEYGKGLGISERLKERANPELALDLVIWAPSHLRLRVWAQDHSVRIQRWLAPLEIRTQRGSISARELHADDVLLACRECAIEAEQVRASLRVVAEKGSATLRDVQGDRIAVDVGDGDQRLERIRGEQLYVSKSARIEGQWLNGRVDFQTDSGSVRLRDLSGFASGRTHSGAIEVRARSWRAQDQALFESVQGSIAVFLPPDLQTEIEVWSLFGQARVGYRVRPLAELVRSIGPRPASQFVGFIGPSGASERGSSVLRIYSRHGSVRLEKEI